MTGLEMLQQVVAARHKTLALLLGINPLSAHTLETLRQASQSATIIGWDEKQAKEPPGIDAVCLEADANVLAAAEGWLKTTPVAHDIVLAHADEETFYLVAWRLKKAGYRCLCQSEEDGFYYFTHADEHSQHIVMTATADNFHFAEPLIELASGEGHRVSKLSMQGLTTSRLQGWMRHCDTAWFEWGDGAIQAASTMPKYCRIVCRIHAYELFNNEFLNVNWHNVDEVIFVSQEMKRQFVTQLGNKLPPALLLTVLGNLTLHRPALSRHAKKRNPFYIACVARFTGKKNLFSLIPIMQMLSEKDDRYRLFIAGRVEDRCLYDSFLQCIEQLGLKKHIIIDGVIPASQMAAWYQDKSILLSVSYHESQGMGIFEAMLAGLKPVAFSAAGGLQEYLPPAFLFTHLHQALEELLAVPEAPEVYARLAGEYLNQHHLGEQYLAQWAAEEEKHRFTIVIPCYNREKTIVPAVASALSQRYANYDVIVVDDGSSDESIARLRNVFDDPRLQIILKPHTNAPDTRNAGIQAAQGDYLVWLDSDDLLHPNTLAHYNAQLSRWPETDIISCGMETFGETERNHHRSPHCGAPGRFIEKMPYQNIVTNPGCCVRKDIYRKVGEYDTHFLRAHDYEFWSRAGGESLILFTPRSNVHYRVHDNNLTGIKKRVDRVYEYRIFNQIINRYPRKTLFPGHTRQTVENFIERSNALLLAACDLDALTVVIPAFGEDLGNLDAIFRTLGEQQDKDFHLQVVSDHDLSFLHVPSLRLSEWDAGVIKQHIDAAHPEKYCRIFAIDANATLSIQAISTLKSALIAGRAAPLDGLIPLEHWQHHDR